MPAVFFGAFPSACMDDDPIKHNDIVLLDTQVVRCIGLAFVLLLLYCLLANCRLLISGKLYLWRDCWGFG
jgi:hypothetical protein